MVYGRGVVFGGSFFIARKSFFHVRLKGTLAGFEHPANLVDCLSIALFCFSLVLLQILVIFLGGFPFRFQFYAEFIVYFCDRIHVQPAIGGCRNKKRQNDQNNAHMIS